MNEIKIHTFDTRNFVIWDILKDNWFLNSQQLHNEIIQSYSKMLQETKDKGISYFELKNMLTPQKKKKEICLFFDSTEIDNALYGGVVFKEYFPLIKDFDKICVFEGDLIVGRGNQELIYDLMQQSLTKINPTIYQHSSQYYLVYINNLSKTYFQYIVENLKDFPHFIGFLESTYESNLKNIISTSIGQRYFIYKKQIVMPTSEDDGKDYNETNYPFEKYGFSISSIHEVQYNSFLCYKIFRSSFYPDNNDQFFSINSITSEVEDIHDYQITIEDDKLQYLQDNKFTNYSHIKSITKEELAKLIILECNKNYIFNMHYLPQHNVIKFNFILDFQHDFKNRFLRLIVAVEYQYSDKELRLITMY